MRSITTVLSFFIITQIIAQNTSINYELNGRLSNTQIQDSVNSAQNPFAKFIGEWTLKQDTWIQNWGDKTDTLKIPKHHTITSQINTNNSLLSIIDGPEPNGHIFWSYNPKTKEINHLSSFGEIRAGIGNGLFFEQNNLRLKVKFEGEPKGTYRIYTYKWITNDEYALHSIQFDENDKPTGLFYKGNFIRINHKTELKTKIERVLSILDDSQITKEEQISVYMDDVIHMAPDHETITNKKDLLKYLSQQNEYGYSDMKHSILEYSDHGDIVIMRGQVEGLFYPRNGADKIPFRTKNLFIFSKIKNELKIAKVIYNMSPND